MGPVRGSNGSTWTPAGERWFTAVFVLVPATWAGSFIAGAYVVAEIDPVASVFWRFALSALVMLPALAVFRARTRLDLRDRRLFRHLVIFVVFAGLGYHVPFFLALEHTSPTNAALLISLNPFFTAFGEVLWFRRPRPRRFYVGFVIAFSGAAWVILGRGGELAGVGIGEVLSLGAALVWSVYTLAAKATRDERWDPLWINAYGYLGTALVLVPWLGGSLLGPAWTALSARGWAGCWYMAIFPTAIGYTLYYVGIQRRGPAWASASIYLVPSFAAAFDLLFFRTAVTAAMVLGTALVVVGLAVGNAGSEQVRRLTAAAGRSLSRPGPGSSCDGEPRQG